MMVIALVRRPSRRGVLDLGSISTNPVLLCNDAPTVTIHIPGFQILLARGACTRPVPQALDGLP